MALCPPPSVLGRFVARLLTRCQHVAPVGFYEEGGCACLPQFGEPYALELPSGVDREQLDRCASQAIMVADRPGAAHPLRGEYG